MNDTAEKLLREAAHIISALLLAEPDSDIRKAYEQKAKVWLVDATGHALGEPDPDYVSPDPTRRWEDSL